jgi:hypothetical protein
MVDYMPWPEKRRSLFDMNGAGYGSPTWCSLDWINDERFGPERIADEFKRAADKLVESLVTDADPMHRDGLFMPVAYLYRHALELKIKHLISLAASCELITEKEQKNIAKSHKIVLLWQVAKRALLQRWPRGDRRILNNVEALLTDFHKVDKTGQGLRYHDTAGARAIEKYPKSIDLLLLKNALDESYVLLDGCCMDLGQARTEIEDQVFDS